MVRQTPVQGGHRGQPLPCAIPKNLNCLISGYLAQSDFTLPTGNSNRQGDCLLNFCHLSRGLKSTTGRKSALKRTQNRSYNTF